MSTVAVTDATFEAELAEMMGEEGRSYESKAFAVVPKRGS